MISTLISKENATADFSFSLVLPERLSFNVSNAKIAQILGFPVDTWKQICAQNPRFARLELTQALKIKGRMEKIKKQLHLTQTQWQTACLQNSALLTVSPQLITRYIHKNAAFLGVSKEDWIKLCQRSGYRLFLRNPNTLRTMFHQTVRLLNHPEKCSLDILKTLTTEEKKRMASFAGVQTTAEAYRRFCLNHAYALTTTPQATVLKAAKLCHVFKHLGYFNTQKPSFCEISSYLGKSAQTIDWHLLYFCHVQHQTGERLSKSKLMTFTSKETILKTVLPKGAPQEIAHFPCPLLKRLQQIHQR